MAKSTLNSALKDISGAIDGWLYRQLYGRTVISPRPIPNDARTPAQQEQRARFQTAGAFAKAACADPAKRAFYAAVAAARNVPLVSVMMADFFRPPTVDAIDLTGYHGAIADPIAIRASDDVGVVGVSVALRGADQTLLEEGAAALESGGWVYRATTARTAGVPVTITATALDRPGNTGTKTETWE